MALRHQTVTPYEVIVMDDGSTDNTEQNARRIKGVKNLSVISFNHTGKPGLLRNSGAKWADGNILVFMDADMLPPKDYIERITKSIIAGKDIATTHSEEYAYNTDSWIATHLFNKVRAKETVGARYGVARAILKSAFLKKGGFDARRGYFDDAAPVRARVVDAVIYHHNPDTIGKAAAHYWWVLRSIMKNTLRGWHDKT